MDYKMTIGDVELSPIELPAQDSYSCSNIIIGEHRRDIYGNLRSNIKAIKKRWSMTLLATTRTSMLAAYLDGQEINFIDYSGEAYVIKLTKFEESMWPKDVYGKGYGLTHFDIELEEV